MKDIEFADFESQDIIGHVLERLLAKDDEFYARYCRVIEREKDKVKLRLDEYYFDRIKITDFMDFLNEYECNITMLLFSCDENDGTYTFLEISRWR